MLLHKNDWISLSNFSFYRIVQAGTLNDKQNCCCARTTFFNYITLVYLLDESLVAARVFTFGQGVLLVLLLHIFPLCTRQVLPPIYWMYSAWLFCCNCCCCWSISPISCIWLLLCVCVISSVNHNAKRISFSVSSRFSMPLAICIQHTFTAFVNCARFHTLRHWNFILIGSPCADNLGAICIWICLSKRVRSYIWDSAVRYIRDKIDYEHLNGTACVRFSLLFWLCFSYFVTSLNKSTNHTLNL